ncbi:ribosome maturation factor RimM [Aquibacillus sp. 3ASR75-11]|uniref:Ribosome maturation factor RimM n=1 Tax=Terrihalobacillus insolitus TaxID=2950438 RepID=A0A9X3WQV8_9BACI|nr:ribosome maturation factor RimM [Terrihalobacillus insolitus]MDC3412922.1 ribosome maturation factor RimM [Terrihalobacillus insolitus]MDC3423600.1 ribosome maturation factor RimM [Terrihalobacillus insolitus]
MSSMYNVGKIVNTHGINGEVRVIRITDFEERFQKGQTLYYKKREESDPIPLVIDGHRKHKQFDLLHFESHHSINDVEQLMGTMLMVSEDQLGVLDEGEYYYHEIIGCHVYTMTGEALGVVKEILSPGANDVWVVQRNGKKDVLIPYIDDVVKEVNIETKSIKIEPLEGLID